MSSPRYELEELTAFAHGLFQWAGLPEDRAASTARLLVRADLMGHTTHGLQLCGPHIKQFQSAEWSSSGEIEVVSDKDAAILWDANYVAPMWVTEQAVALAVDRAEIHGTAMLSIRRSGHIGCLEVFLQAAVDRGCLILLTCSDPSVAGVAPFGGIDPVFTPNPLAVGIPTEGDPILFDIGSSITTIGRTMRTRSAGEKMPGEWLLTAEGLPTDDPSAAVTEPPGTLMPIGGMQYGYKGFALALMVEALSQALSGYGRADDVKTWGAGVYIQVISPDAFGGKAAFTTQTEFLAEACRASRPRPDTDGEVRLPGQRALALERDMRENGVILDSAVVESLETWGGRAGIRLPEPTYNAYTQTRLDYFTSISITPVQSCSGGIAASCSHLSPSSREILSLGSNVCT